MTIPNEATPANAGSFPVELRERRLNPLQWSSQSGSTGFYAESARLNVRSQCFELVN